MSYSFKRPMLAPRESPLSHPKFFEGLRFPLLCSYKFDGIRAVNVDGAIKSRTMKLIPSWQVQNDLADINWTDGELIAGEPTEPGVLSRTSSHTRSMDKKCDDLRYYVFDTIDLPHVPFYKRLEQVKERLHGAAAHGYRFVEHENVETVEELLVLEEKALSLGYEGLMMRDPLGRYKQGRGTFREGLIYKLKRFEDAEGIVVDLYEKETNTNEKKVNELGLTSRSSSKEGKVGADTLGGFIVDYKGTELRVAPGNFDDADKKRIWNNPEKEALGKLLKFKWMKYGMKDVPRFCSAIEFRDNFDK
jgi:DNA ligase 1